MYINRPNTFEDIICSEPLNVQANLPSAKQGPGNGWRGSCTSCPFSNTRKKQSENEGVLTSWVDGEAGEGRVAAARGASPKTPLAVAAPLAKADGGRGAAAGSDWTTLSRGASGGTRGSWGNSLLASGALGAATAASGYKDVENNGIRNLNRRQHLCGKNTIQSTNAEIHTAC